MEDTNPSKKENPKVQEPSSSHPIEPAKLTSPNQASEQLTSKVPEDIPEQIEKPSLNNQLDPLISLALEELINKRNILKKEIEELKSKKSQIEKELKNSFAGQSDAIARRLQGFKDYLVGAFQDLAQSAEQLELVAQPVVVKPV